MGDSLDFDIINAFQATFSAMHLTEKNVRSVLYEMDLPELDELEREQHASQRAGHTLPVNSGNGAVISNLL